MTPMSNNSNHAFLPSCSLGEPCMRRRTEALHGGPVVSILCTTPCLTVLALKSCVSEPGYLRRIRLYLAGTSCSAFS